MVATAGTDFSVQHVEVVLGIGVETNTTAITTVTLSKAFVYHTYLTTVIGDNPDEGHPAIDLQDDSTVRCRRGFDDFADTPSNASGTVTAHCQIISAGGTEFSVERNECDWGDALTEAVTITAIDQTKAIVVAGGYQGCMNSTETNGADTDGNYATYKFTSDTVMTGTRATNTDPDGTSVFEVVEFALVEAGNNVTLAVTAIGVAAFGAKTIFNGVDLCLIFECRARIREDTPYRRYENTYLACHVIYRLLFTELVHFPPETGGYSGVPPHEKSSFLMPNEKDK